MNKKNNRIYLFVSLLVLGTSVIVSDPVGKHFRDKLNIHSYAKQGHPNKPSHSKNEIVVKFKKQVPNSELGTRAKSLGLQVTKISQRPHFATAFVSDGESIQEAIQRVKRDPAVEYAEPKYYYKALATAPNDPDFSKLWGLKNSGQTISSPSYTTGNPGTPNKDMNVLGAWDVTTDCSSIIVAVLDTGVNYNHEDLVGNMWNGSASCKDPDGATIGGGCPYHGWDFAGNRSNTMDDQGHGSHVAGTIAAVGNNGKGISGVCQTAKIMSVKVLGADGFGSNDNIAEGILFAVRNGAKVINMSLGGTSFSQVIYDAIEEAKNNDVLVVVAAGNENADLLTEGSYPCKNDNANLICIAALDQNYDRADFSNYDSNGTATNRTVDFGAPGTNIYSLFGTEVVYNEGNTNYSGWTVGGIGGTTNWAFQSCNFTLNAQLVNLKGMAIPNDCSVIDWNFTSPYPIPTAVSPSIQRTAYKTFTIPSNSTKVLLQHIVISDGQGSESFCFDYTEAFYKNASGSPFSSGFSQIIMEDHNREIYVNRFCRLGINSFIDYEENLLTACMNSSNTNCTVGYRFTSDSTIQNGGAIFGDFILTAWAPSTNTYGNLDGTSMATPNAAGVAALIRSYNPLFTYAEVIQKLIDGGTIATSLSSNTKYGKSINANDSMKHINQVTGVSAIVP